MAASRPWRTDWDVGEPLCCHSWNKDRTEVAVCPSSSSVLILRRSTTEDGASIWTRVSFLNKHQGQVSAVDWAQSSDKILSGSYDGNAYVWERREGSEQVWNPTAVQLRSMRAVLCVAWSPSEAKFALGSGARTLSVCYFDDENKWWVGKVIRKKHESAVTSTAWHPNSLLLATTSTDHKCRIFSVGIKEVDLPHHSANHSATSDGFLPGKFGEQLVELDLAMGWAFGVSWSPSGRHLAFSGHECSIHFVNDVGPGLSTHSVHSPHLPCTQVCFLSDALAVAVGFECKPLLYQADDQGEWSFCKALEESQMSLKETLPEGTQTPSAHNSKIPSDGMHTAHSAPILSLCVQRHLLEQTQSAMFSTAGLDGKLIIWDVPNKAAFVGKIQQESQSLHETRLP